MKRRLTIAVLTILGACRSSAPQATVPLPAAASPTREIAELEDERTTGNGCLIEIADDRDPTVRQRAVRALGRMPFPEIGEPVTLALVESLKDSDGEVRAEAAFALGVRGDPAAGDALVLVLSDGDPLVRARAVEAASKLARPDLRERVLAALDDSDPSVRLEAACAPQRWPATDEDASAVNAILIARLQRESDPGVLAYGLFSIERRKAKEAAKVVLAQMKSPDGDVRLFAIRCAPVLLASEGGLPLDMLESIELAALVDQGRASADWRVACSAARALNISDTFSFDMEAQSGLTKHSSANVRRATWDSLRAFVLESAEIDLPPVDDAARSELWLKWMTMTWDGGILRTAESALIGADTSAMVRADAAEFLVCVEGALTKASLASGYPPTEVPKWAETRLEDSSAIVRAGVARGLARLNDSATFEKLHALAQDTDPAVAGAALEALGKHKTKFAHETLLDFLHAPDNGLRLAALTGLLEQPEAGDIADLEFVFDDSKGDIATEVRFNALRVAGKIGGERAKALLVRTLAAEEPFVRRAAREELALRWPNEPLPPPTAPALERAALPDVTYESNPFVAIATNRGTMVFELFPDEAPVHVHNLLELARRGYYDGLSFHRVVPDFVIQGGDYRGDGNGGTTFRVEEDVRALYAAGKSVPASSLRHEFTPRKYVRGSLGMPRNEDVDSGGSQFFVTHRATPHLDGRYTLFGELREGLEVLDAIEVGDRIESVRVLAEVP